MNVVTIQKLLFDSTDEAEVRRVAKLLNVPMNIARNSAGVGKLVACKTCLEKCHFAPWRSDVAIRVFEAQFREHHKH